MHRPWFAAPRNVFSRPRERPAARATVSCPLEARLQIVRQFRPPPLRAQRLLDVPDGGPRKAAAHVLLHAVRSQGGGRRPHLRLQALASGGCAVRCGGVGVPRVLMMPGGGRLALPPRPAPTLPRPALYASPPPAPRTLRMPPQRHACQGQDGHAARRGPAARQGALLDVRKQRERVLPDPHKRRRRPAASHSHLHGLQGKVGGLTALFVRTCISACRLSTWAAPSSPRHRSRPRVCPRPCSLKGPRSRASA